SVNGHAHRGDFVRVAAAVGDPTIPLVGVGRTQPQHARATRLGTDEDRRTVLTRSSGSQFALARLVKLALEIDRALTQQRHDDLQRLLKAADAALPRVAKGGELTLVVTCAEPQHDTAT